MHKQFFKILQHEAGPWDPQKGKFNYIKWPFFDINQTNIKFFINCINFWTTLTFATLRKNNKFGIVGKPQPSGIYSGKQNKKTKKLFYVE